MGIAHEGSQLPIQDYIIPVDYQDRLFPFYWNTVSGRGDEPLTDVTTFVPDPKFGQVIAVEDGTTNMINTTANLLGWSGSTFTRTLVTDGAWAGWYRVDVTRVGTGSPGFGHICYIPYLTLTANTTYTFSIEYYCPNDDVKLIIDGTGGFGAPTSIGGYKYVRTNSLATTTTHNFWWYHKTLADTPVTTYFYYRNPQCEQASYPTSFVNGTRVAGELTYPQSLVNTTSFTINLWVKHTALPTSITVPGSGRVPLFEICNAITATNRIVFGFRNDNNILDLYVSDTNGANNIGITTTYAAVYNTWTMYTLTCSNGTYSIYVNGQLVKTQKAIQFTLLPTATLNVGGKIHGRLNGQISNFMISPRVMDADEVNVIYQYGKPLYDPYNYYSIYG